MIPRIAGLLLVLLAAACTTPLSSVPPRVELAEGVDFQAYRSFALVPPARGAGDASARDLERALRFELTDRGLTEASVGEADLVISFDVQARGRTRVTSWDPDEGWTNPPYDDDLATSVLVRGILVAEAVDPARGRVWRGVAGTESFGLGLGTDPLRALAAEVLATLPVGQLPARPRQ